MVKIIYVCSPLRGDIENNRAKAAGYCSMVVAEGYIPFAPHLYFTEFLKDEIPIQRETGMKLGIDFIYRMNPEKDELWYFGEGISQGMQAEIDTAKTIGMKIKNIL
ncbi:MAG: hypothetical protein BWY46_01421 [Firmicutes bacterium ADurb.Bin300]|nr:MAG: hypothetical protein BWY46_01421 [Firmicutes bacterium ADurb.Bin300]